MADIPTVVLGAGGGGGLPDTGVNGIVVRNSAAPTTVARAITGDASIDMTNGNGVTGNPLVSRAALTGDVTATGGSNATTIANNAVTYAKIQDVSAASVLLGRGAGGGAGDPQEIVLGTNLSMAGTTLNAAGGSGGNGVEATVDFGAASDYATVTVTGQAWVTGTSKIVASLFGNTVDHDEEDALLEEIEVLITARVVGTGFDVHCFAPNGTFGTYKVHCVGV